MKKKTLNNDIEFNKIIFSWNSNCYNFICSFNLNTFDINLLKLSSSLQENAHILNKASQNINNIGKKMYMRILVTILNTQIIWWHYNKQIYTNNGKPINIS